MSHDVDPMYAMNPPQAPIYKTYAATATGNVGTVPPNMTFPDERVYIAGPMTGLPDFNYPAFHEAERQLEKQSYIVHNPANHFGGDQTLPREAYLRKAMEEVLKVDHIALLPDWQSSAGAKLEVAMGLELRCGFLEYGPEYGFWGRISAPYVERVLTATPSLPWGDQKTVCEEAQDLVYGDRQQDYGHPYEDFNRTAGLWNAMFGHKMIGEFTAEDVALGMICVKMSRQVNRAKRDNLVDICGYAATLEMVRERIKEMGLG